MALQKLTSTDAFVIVDLPEAPASGMVRRARKILQSSARDLARSATYTFGAFGLERSGASAGVNAEDGEAAGSLAAFVAELVPQVAGGRLQLTAGKGVDPQDLAGLTEASGAGPGAGSETVTVAGVLAATRWALGGELAGRTVAIEGAEQAPASLRQALSDAGATVVDVWGVSEKPWLVWGAAVDAVLAGSKPGTLSHQGAGYVTARAIVPWGPIPVTTKAFAQLRRAGVTVVPDFVSIAGSVLGGVLDGDEATLAATVADQVTDVLDDSAADAEGVLLGACHRAEAFIAGWHGSLPFGRPLAG